MISGGLENFVADTLDEFQVHRRSGVAERCESLKKNSKFEISKPESEVSSSDAGFLIFRT